MRTVAKTPTVISIWLEQSQPYMRNEGKTVYFEAQTIYSYGPHAPIGWLDGKNKVVIVTVKRFSVTTAGHCNQIHQTARQAGYTVFRCPSFTDHELNHRHLLGKTQQYLRQATRARRYASWELDQAQTAWEQVEAYGRIYKLPMPDMPPALIAAHLTGGLDTTTLKELATLEL